MSVETSLVTALTTLCSGRCYPDFAAHNTTRPYVTYTQVGGAVLNPLNGSVPGKRNARVQINVWADTRQAANELMRSIEDALRPSPLNGRPIGALIARVDGSTSLRGAQQDFSLWW